ncbi:hypothetical protein [Pseudomonas protegens]
MNTIGPGIGVAVICSLFVFPLSAIAGYTFPTCQQAWIDAPARQSCKSISSGSKVIPEAAESKSVARNCDIKVMCKQNNGAYAPQDDVTVDVTQVPVLNNCNGHLKVGDC